ncbi:MAG: V-type ATPase subunit [Clostridia bacterium]|nr:V-type ATPase subunit [Clostridia bacterium]
MPVKSYGFAIGNLAARQNTLLKKSDLTQLLAAKDVDALSDALRDKGLGSRTVREEVPLILKNENARMWEFLREISPDDSLFLPFTVENDFHNLKAVLKGVIKNKEYSDSLILPSDISEKTLKTAIEEKKFDLLPEYMAECAKRAYEILTGSGDAQLSDAVLDAACMAEQMRIVSDKGYKCPVAREIVEYTVFFNNVKTALRAAKAQKNGAFLDDALTETKYISKAELKSATLGGTEQLLDKISLGSSAGQDAADSFKKSPGDFERFCDDYIMSIAKKAKLITLGSDPIVGYMMARRAEIKDIRIIYSGIKTGRPEAEIIGRLRELYD